MFKITKIINCDILKIHNYEHPVYDQDDELEHGDINQHVRICTRCKKEQYHAYHKFGVIRYSWEDR